MALYPPQLQFQVRVLLERRAYMTTNGSSVWETVSELNIGPQNRIATSDTHVVRAEVHHFWSSFDKWDQFQVKAEYVADFHPNSFVESKKLAHRFLLVPDMSTLPSTVPFPDVDTREWNTFVSSVKNISEWMAIEKQYFDLSGYSCNKIGVSYTAFRHQPNRCVSKYSR